MRKHFSDFTYSMWVWKDLEKSVYNDVFFQNGKNRWLYKGRAPNKSKCINYSKILKIVGTRQEFNCRLSGFIHSCEGSEIRNELKGEEAICLIRLSSVFSLVRVRVEIVHFLHSHP